MPADAVHRDDESLALLALGALTPEEAREVEEHVAECAECRRRLGKRLGELAALAESADPVAPPAGAREALLARLDAEPAADSVARGAAGARADEAERAGRGTAIDLAAGGVAGARHDERERSAPGTPTDLAAGRPAGVGLRPARPAGGHERPAPDRTPPPRRLAARRPARLLLPLAASFLLGAVVGVVAVRQAFVGDVRRLGDEAASLSAERDAALRRAEDLSRDLAVARTALALAPSPEAVPLAGLAAAPQARGRVFVDRAGARAVFVARGLPALPEDRTYQLWRIVDGQPLPAGLLDATEGAVIVEGVGATPGEVWAVTVEPRGGVEAPSGEMVLLSS